MKNLRGSEYFPYPLYVVQQDRLIVLSCLQLCTKTQQFRAGRYDDMYWIDEIKSLSFHIMFYRLFRGVAKYIVYCNTFSSFSLSDCDFYTPPTTGREAETETGGERPARTKQGARS